MVRLSVVGTVGLVGPSGTNPEQLLAQPKRFGILAYMMLSRPSGPQRRDTLLRLFWPDMEPSRARENLRQALSYLRKSLGGGLIVSHGSVSVEVAWDAVWCDALEVERLVGIGEREAALELYGGELLPGFYVSGASAELDQWLDQERVRLQRLATEAARSLAEEAESSGEVGAAIRWTRRELEIDAAREGTLRRLAHLLDRAGDLPAAVGECDRFAAQLEAIYQDAPTARTQALAEELRDRLRAARPVDDAPLGSGSEELRDTSEGAEPADEAPIGSESDAGHGEAGTGDPASSHAEAETTPVAASGHSPDAGRPPAATRGRGRPWRRRALPVAGALLTLVALAAGWLVLSGRGDGAAAADRTVVAVFPFRTSGADPRLEYLSDGMVDLIATRLTGGPLPSAVNATAAIRAWHREASDGTVASDERARQLAAGLRAGAAVLGNIVGTPERLHLSATLISAEDGRRLAEARVAGPADSLSHMVDDLTARLVLRHYGMPEHRMMAVPRVPLAAIEAYLRAEEHYRHGRFVDAVREHRAALALDSMFAPAVLGALTGLLWTGDGEGMEAVVPLAVAIEDRLSQPDRVLLAALLSSFHPEPRPFGDRIAAWERVVEVQPDSPEGWFQLGDHLYHWGPALGFPAAAERARVAFRRAVELDSTMVAAVTHLAVLLAETGELDAARALYDRRARDAASDGQRHLYEWMFTRMSGEPDPAIDDRLAAMNPLYISALVGTAQLHGFGLPDAEKAIDRLYDDVGPRGTEAVVYTQLYHAALNRGRPDEVRRVADRVATWFPGRYDHLRMPVMAALYSDGDTAYAAHAARELGEVQREMLRSGAAPDQHAEEALCTLEQWNLRRGDPATAERTISLLERDADQGEHPLIARQRQGCALFLSGLLDIARGNPARAIPALERLSRNPLDGYYGWWEPVHLPNLVLADLYAELDRPDAALEVVRRRPHHSQWGSQYLTSFLVREGELAAAVGDRAGAIEAYRHYLRLRQNAEGGAAAATEHVRDRLRDLEAGARSRS